MPEASASETSAPEDRAGEWSAVLDRLEHDAGAAAALLAAASGDGHLSGGPDGGAHLGEALLDWWPPSGLRAIPEELLNRASSMAELQQQLLERLAAARTAAARQLAALESIPTAVPSGTAVYLDVEG